MKRFDYNSTDGNASNAPALNLKEFDFIDHMQDDDFIQISYRCHIKYFVDGATEVICECIVDILDWTNMSPEGIRESVMNVIPAWMNSKVEYNCTIELR